ncbi:unnamed protein product [Vitrella brassicaformis CCMP3155]|uniref:Uncharacterized protein n=2 Tax=Vitrella brassicaformis TaxID=1169539 RepID=A0A0G4H4X4_VITBC|nr:unnamed protein product [Vitrella brassicaformis CCMP3155]|eukprot:CEM38608.1 unnamed protein product [Vitrella brassicaformis CCMP3155]
MEAFTYANSGVASAGHLSLQLRRQDLARLKDLWFCLDKHYTMALPFDKVLLFILATPAPMGLRRKGDPLFRYGPGQHRQRDNVLAFFKRLNVQMIGDGNVASFYHTIQAMADSCLQTPVPASLGEWLRVELGKKVSMVCGTISRYRSAHLVSIINIQTNWRRHVSRQKLKVIRAKIRFANLVHSVRVSDRRHTSILELLEESGQALPEIQRVVQSARDELKRKKTQDLHQQQQGEGEPHMDGLGQSAVK